MKRAIICGGMGAILALTGGVTAFATSWNSTDIPTTSEEPIASVSETISSTEVSTQEVAEAQLTPDVEETATVDSETTENYASVCYNEDCPTGGVPALDGTGYHGGNAQGSNCDNEDCPNGGVPAQDGTGYHGGNAQGGNGNNADCPTGGVPAQDGTGYHGGNSQGSGNGQGRGRN